MFDTLPSRLLLRAAGRRPGTREVPALDPSGFGSRAIHSKRSGNGAWGIEEKIIVLGTPC